MNYWILKTEPETYSFQDLLKDKKTTWDGVRNYQARNNIRAMKEGDLAVIYESVGPKAAVGVAKIASEPYKEKKTTEDWSVVDIAPLKSFVNPVTLSDMKADKALKEMKLVRQSRLSVSPLTAEEFKTLVKRGGIKI
jgi:predicted RNA-binding protein with PUA-like domain